MKIVFTDFVSMSLHTLANDGAIRLRETMVPHRPKSEIGVVFKSVIGVGFIVRRCSD